MKNYLFVLLIVFLACNNSKKNSTNPSTPGATTFEAIPKEKIDYLYHNCDYTDYIFHHLPFSMSQNEKEAILQNFSFIGADPMPTIPPGCKPIARQMFHVKGEIVTELDVYFSDNCKFYTWVENEKPIYAVKMTEAGAFFYQQMIDRAAQASKQMQQQHQQQQQQQQ